MKILVTGGSGFIGSNLVEKLILEHEHTVCNVDKMTYAGSTLNLRQVQNTQFYQQYQQNIVNLYRMNQIFDEFSPDAVMHLAAESHVDRSINGPSEFVDTNILGTVTMLTAYDKYLEDQPTKRKMARFIHVSTDEVYGSLGLDDAPFDVNSPYEPNSPYAATKAASDHLVRAWTRTYGFPGIITNCSNNYGPYQHPEKFIPKVILNLLHGIDVPIYGTGKNMREWIHVSDHCDALIDVLHKGEVGGKYLIGSDFSLNNLEVIDAVIAGICEFLPAKENTLRDLLTFVTDRKGHDLRYAISSETTHKLGWRPQTHWDEGIKATVKWYIDNQDWYRGVLGCEKGRTD